MLKLQFCFDNIIFYITFALSFGFSIIVLNTWSA